MDTVNQLEALNKLELELQAAISLKNYNTAKRLLRRLDVFDLELQAQRVRIPALAKLLIADNKHYHARKLLIDNFGYIWNSEEELTLLRTFNEPISRSSKLFCVSYKDGKISIGHLTVINFTNQIKFYVMADSGLKAINYIEEVCHITGTISRSVEAYNEQTKVFDNEHLGIYKIVIE